MRVLYIHMIGAFGGASRSLLEAVRSFPDGAVESFFVTPRGSAAEQFQGVASDVIEVRGMSQFDNTHYSYYHGVRWIVLLREILYLPFTVMGLLRARWRWGHVDLIHVNEFTGVLPWLLARKLFGAPVVVHVRSLARKEESSRVTRWINRLLREHADAVIAIDENVRASLPSTLDVQVIHNSFSTADGGRDTRLLEVIQQLRAESFKVGFVGNLLRVKGLFELVEAAYILRQEGLDIEYLVVGDDAHRRGGLRKWILGKLGLGQDIKAELFEMIDRYELTECFHFSGFTKDIRSAFKAMDVLCFPSHFDAPGRPIFEAAFLGVPSIAAVRNPRADTLVDGETGLAVSPKDPVQLAAAIRSLAADRKKCEQLGRNAHELAQMNFDTVTNASHLLRVYRSCMRGTDARTDRQHKNKEA
jgi:glycosyltransferase involved in cell wall biosynthesis